MMARAAFVTLFAVAAFSTRVFAADYVVTKTTDSSDGACDVDCSLREAIVAANASPGADRIILGSGVIYALSLGPADAPAALVSATGDLDITDALTIDGNGSMVDAGGIDRVFDIRGSGAVTINSLTIANGIASGFLSLGGGIYIGAGAAVVLNGSTVTGNGTAFEGGARDNGGGIAVVGVYDAATGVATSASLTLASSTVSGNTGLNGGGIACVLCSLTIATSTIAGNLAEGTDGGGIDVVGDSSTVSITSSNLSSNTVGGGRGGALSVPFGASTSTLSRDRIVSNTGTTGAAIYNSIAAITAINNWWGCNFGPGAGGVGCAAATNGTAGSVTATPFLVLQIGAAPAAILVGGSSAVTADLTFNSSSADTSAGGTLPNGISAAFSGSLGTFATPTSPTSAGKAVDIFTASATGSASISTTVDAQSVGTSILTSYATSTTLQGAPASPVFVADAVLLTASVASDPAGGTPSGTVTFKDGTTTLAGCGGVALNAGGVATCNIPGNSLSAGVKSFTAAFAGGVEFLPSVSPVLAYTYLAGSSRIITTGAEAPGAPLVRRFLGGTGQPISGPTAQFQAFASGFSGGVRVADADLTGDGVADIIAGTGSGAEPRVVVFDGVTGGVVRELVPGFPGTAGVYVAAGDVDGDGWPDVVMGDGGGSTLVRVVSGASGVPVWSTSIADPVFTAGVRVASGDVNGDGYADLIVGSGPGFGSKVRVFSGATHAELLAFTPYGGFVGGVYVAAGDVNGDGYADVITGADAGGGPHVRVFDGATGVEQFGFFATDGSFTGGVRVAAGDVTGDGHADVITALGPGGDLVQAFDSVSGAFVGTPIAVAPPSGGGLFVSTAVPTNRMVIDAPVANATLPPDFVLNGWAFEEEAPGTGVDAIHVWAYPVGGAPPVFLGAAALGDSRPDVAAIFGARYATSGYHLDVTGLADGTYDVVAFAHSSASGVFNMRRVVRVRIVSPGAEVQIHVDLPASGPVRPTFRVAGWAFDVGGAGTGTGIEAVHVWAFPTSGAAPMFVGAATLGDARPDVAAIFGPRAANAGYHLDVTGFPAGDYVLGAYAKALALPAFTVAEFVNITVTPWALTTHHYVDLPAPGLLPGGSFVVAGWALVLDGPTAPGIAAVHVWAYPVGGGSPSFLGAATLGGERPDVASIFGPGYLTSGFGLSVAGLPSGTWDLAVFPLAEGATAFSSASVVRITIP